MSPVLAIDLGGTRLRAAIASQTETVRDLGDQPAPADLDAFVRSLRDLRAAVGDISGVGIAVPGLVEQTVCRWIPNLPYLDGLDVAALFPDLPVALGNDAQIALLAEATAGAAAGLSDVVLLSIGTGIGSAVLVGGQIVRGSHGGACSFGWASADIDDEGDDKSGWLERVAAGRAFDQLAASLGHADGRALITAAQRGDVRAAQAIERPAQAIGVALAGAVALLDPAAILITGGVAASADVLFPPIRTVLRRQLPPHLRDVDLRAGAFGTRAALVGAGVAAAAGPEWWLLR